MQFYPTALEAAREHGTLKPGFCNGISFTVSTTSCQTHVARLEAVRTTRNKQMLQQKTRVAAVQAAPALLDIEKSVAKTIDLMEQAAAQGAELVVFPETWISGYPWWIWLGTPAETIHYSGDYVANCIEADDEYDRKLRNAANRMGIHAIVGVAEKAGGSLYMGQWHYGPDGEVIGRRRKLKPTHVERAVFGEGDGTDIRVNETNIGRVGALCCWEHLQPLTKYAMYAQNEQIHAASWPGFSVYTDITYAMSPDLSMAINQTYAAEGQCYVVCATSVITPELLEFLCKRDEQKRLIKIGGGYARIFGPDGSPQGTPLSPEEEGLLVAEINLGKIAYCKAAADPAGHYARADVLRLMFNREPRTPVVALGNGDSTQDVHAAVDDDSGLDTDAK